MTIFFSGHQFKYELEGIAKLFFPVMRFELSFDKIELPKGDYIITRMHKGSKKTLLWVASRVGKSNLRKAYTLPNAQASNAECERMLCVLLYRLLQEQTGITPMWGILTGIRPVATVQKLRRQGMTDLQIDSLLAEKYLVSEQKRRLAFLTADTQAPLLIDPNEKSYSLYVSIPFCKSRCSYCSFVSHAITTRKSLELVEKYLELLCGELQETAKLAKDCGLTLKTIYIGGGTPTALTAVQLKKVTDAITESFDVASVVEYTIEAGRADTITAEKLEVIKQSKATRISVNPQSFNDEVLQAIGRKHTAREAEESFLLARSMGLGNINMDFIAGLPKDTLESFKKSIDKAIELEPQSITVHTLSIKRSSELFEAAAAIGSQMTHAMTEYAQEALTKAGYLPYYLYRQKNTLGNLENVGYAKKGYENLYNIYIMDEVQTILACGAGASTKLVYPQERNAFANNDGDRLITRVFNYKYHFEYIDGFDEIIKRKAEVKKFYDGQISKQQN